ncbi:MAG: orotate phosphoribosyltransferase [Nitrospira sp.]|nr:orotate phosphoribosyltransferase [Candidatus Manganitrophaceae bacterium]HIL34340.1 orotate phosphoribosyltransferase [Candidatus Manganitrophaceae bacterium]
MSFHSSRQKLLDLLFQRAFRYSEEPSFQLTSRKMSSFYIDCKKVSLDAEGAYLIGEEIFERVRAMEAIEGIGGMTLGADPIATAVSVVSFIRKKPIPAFIVRKEPKEHGSGQQVEGALKEGAKLVVVEDVVTTGGSTIRALKALRESGFTVAKVISLIDRKEGGAERILQEKVEFESLYTIDDFMRLVRKESVAEIGSSRDA